MAALSVQIGLIGRLPSFIVRAVAIVLVPMCLNFKQITTIPIHQSHQPPAFKKSDENKNLIKYHNYSNPAVKKSCNKALWYGMST